MTKARQGGPHVPHVARAVPKGEFPPGVRCNFGEPSSEKASPFVQVHLPVPFAFRGRKSHAVSFQGPVALVRGTRRSKEQAESCVLSWAWAWWESLTVEQQSGIGAGSEHAAKRQRVS